MKKTLVSETLTGPEESYLVAQKKESTSVRTTELQVIYIVLLNQVELLRISRLTYQSNPGYIAFSSNLTAYN